MFIELTDVLTRSLLTINTNHIVTIQKNSDAQYCSITLVNIPKPINIRESYETVIKLVNS